MEILKKVAIFTNKNLLLWKADGRRWISLLDWNV